MMTNYLNVCMEQEAESLILVEYYKIMDPGGLLWENYISWLNWYG